MEVLSDPVYPADWKFGGADGSDPAADPRYETTNYRYLDARLEVLWYSAEHRSDETAIDGRSIIEVMFGEPCKVYAVQVRRPGDDKYKMLWRDDSELG